MAVRVERFEDTPNPNALKCVLQGELAALGRPGGPLRSYASVEAAHDAGDALGAALVGLPGVASVLITPSWITLVRRPGGVWAPIKKGASKAVARHAGDAA